MNTIVQIVFEYPNANCYVMEDFNSDFTRGDLFGDECMQICYEHSLSIADKELLPDSTFTCISNAHGTTSWLDHCVTSVTGLDNKLLKVSRSLMNIYVQITFRSG